MVQLNIEVLNLEAIAQNLWKLFGLLLCFIGESSVVLLLLTKTIKNNFH